MSPLLQLLFAAGFCLAVYSVGKALHDGLVRFADWLFDRLFPRNDE